MLKKFFTLLVILSFMLSPIASYAFEIKDIKPNRDIEQDIIVSKRIENEIYASIEEIYGKKEAENIFNSVMRIAFEAIKNRPEELKKEDINRTDDWYKDEIIYMFYVDQFGVVKTNKPNTFNDTARMFKYLKDLGVTTLYLLPFAESPMSDSGFDVKNPRNIRADLGGKPQFIEFVKKARENGFKIKSDLVLNHVSDEHKWFQDFLKGNTSNKNYFVVKNDMPEFRKYNDEKVGTIVEYTDNDGKVSKRRLMFPELTDSHYRKVVLNGEDYYFYHTFYPFQLDVNWENPEVLYYWLRTINEWTNIGIDIFRLDAIPYLSKEDGTNAENLPKTHEIVKLISSYIKMTAPRTVIQAEACQYPNDILPYFGKDKRYKMTINGEEKELIRTSEFQIAYHFPYMPAIWASLVTGDKQYFINAYKDTPKIPDSATWGVFLRVHDELTLEMIDLKTREIIYNDLITKGAEFRKGLGVSGRLANFLDNNPDRIEMAFSILMSMSGIPIIYYGDEIGARNNFANAQKSEQERIKKHKRSKIKLLSYFDSRDINRGAIPSKYFYGATKNYYEFNSKVYKRVKNLIALRKSLPSMSRGDFILLKTKSPSCFAYIRSLKDEKILVINNLSSEKLITEIKIPVGIVLQSDNKRITHFKNLVNNDNVKVNVSLKNRTIHLRIKPYGIVWLKLQ